jgi:hypothetical protein
VQAAGCPHRSGSFFAQFDENDRVSARILLIFAALQRFGGPAGFIFRYNRVNGLIRTFSF